MNVTSVSVYTSYFMMAWFIPTTEIDENSPSEDEAAAQTALDSPQMPPPGQLVPDAVDEPNYEVCAPHSSIIYWKFA